MLYLVIENYHEGKIEDIYARFEAHSNILNSNLFYLVDSWIDTNLRTRYHIMKTNSYSDLLNWTLKWSNLSEFQIIPVIKSRDAIKRIRLEKMISLEPIFKYEDMIEIEFLATIIFSEVYAEILPKEHVMYFLKNFQTKEVIENQISRGYRYFVIKYNAEIVGYFCYMINKSELIISKLYILEGLRYKGIGSLVLDFIKSEALKLNLKTIRLEVNKSLYSAIAFFCNNNFILDKVVNNEYPNGYSTDDIVMYKYVQ